MFLRHESLLVLLQFYINISHVLHVNDFYAQVYITLCECCTVFAKTGLFQ